MAFPSRQHVRQHGATLGKILLLILFLAFAVAFWIWKGQHGVTGNVIPINFSTNDHVAFLRQADNQTNLFVVKLDGTGERQLTQDANLKQGVTWSPDGRKICYAAEIKDESSTAFQLMIFDNRGSTQITSGSGSKSLPEWRPDGLQIAFLVGGVLKVIDPNGDNMEQIYPQFHREGSTESNGEGNDSDESGRRQPPLVYFHWDPNSASVAAVQVAEGEQQVIQGKSDWFRQSDTSNTTPTLVADPETLLILPAGGDKPQIRTETNSKKVGFSWFPDGKRIAVTMSTKDNYGIAVIHADEPRLPAAALFASGSFTVAAENPAVSPDGSRIAFEVWRIDSTENRELIGISVISTDPKNPILIKTAADIPKLPLVVKGKTTNPTWSKDGSRIVYQMMEAGGRHDIWAANPDGSKAANLTNGKGDNFDAVCSPAR
jgi:Tol biopolymer transport system component